MEISHSASRSLVDELAALAAGSQQSERANATVTKVDSDGVVWVRISGSDTDTPCRRTSANVSPGDSVSVRVRNGRAEIEANYTSPSATSREVDGVRKDTSAAAQVADESRRMAEQAITDAEAAHEAAIEAEEAASEAEQAAGEASENARKSFAYLLEVQDDWEAIEEYRTEAGKTLVDIKDDAQTAMTNAGLAQAAATAANTAANGALNSLSDVERVVGTLNWIAEHGEYVAATETSPVDGRVYYTRTGTSPNYTYQVVTEVEPTDNPVTEGWYYLVVDQSVQNYIASHLAQTNYGLNILVDGSNFRIHLGTVDGTRTMGTHIIDAVGNVVASMKGDGTVIGKDGANRTLFTDLVCSMVDKIGFTYFNIGDTANGTVHSYEFTGDGSTQSFSLTTELTFPSTTPWSYQTLIDGEPVESTASTLSSGGTTTIRGVFFATAPESGAEIEFNVMTGSVKHFDFGLRRTEYGTGDLSAVFGYRNIATGKYSVAIGDNTSASGEGSIANGFVSSAGGDYSHAGGMGATASGFASHAEGQDTVASGDFSHAEGLGTVASSEAQTACGKFNVEDANGTYAFIVGNGDVANPSNAFAVDWGGNLYQGGEKAIPTFTKSSWSTSSSEASLPVTPCFVLSLSDMALYYCSGS